MKKQETLFQTYLDEIQELTEAKNYQEALKKVKEVKENNFWTMKQNEVLEQLDSVITKLYTKKVNDEIIKKMSKEDVLNEILSKNKLNLSLFDILINRFGEQIEEKDIELYIQEWLNSKTISNVDKYYILMGLKSLEKLSNSIFKVYNSNLKKFLEVDLKDWDENFHEIKYYQDIYKQIEDYFFKNPSFAKFAESIIDTISMWYFGTKTNYKIDELAENIIAYVESLTQHKEFKDSEFFKWIESILRNRKE